MVTFRLYYFIFTRSIQASVYVLCAVGEAGLWSAMVSQVTNQ